MSPNGSLRKSSIRWIRLWFSLVIYYHRNYKQTLLKAEGEFTVLFSASFDGSLKCQLSTITAVGNFVHWCFPLSSWKFHQNDAQRLENRTQKSSRRRSLSRLTWLLRWILLIPDWFWQSYQLARFAFCETQAGMSLNQSGYYLFTCFTAFLAKKKYADDSNKFFKNSFNGRVILSNSKGAWGQKFDYAPYVVWQCFQSCHLAAFFSYEFRQVQGSLVSKVQFSLSGSCTLRYVWN